MDHSSAEESDISDSDIVEYKEMTCARLRAGKMKVKYGEKTFRCPFCPGKKKQDYNLKDLLQHATGMGAAPKREAKVKATHLGLAMYLEKDLASSLGKPLEIVAYKPKIPKNEEEKFVWPWMGIVVNLPSELKFEEFSRESEDRLRAQFSRFRPLQVTILANVKDQTLCAIIKFAKHWSGFNDASSFEKHFKVEKYGKVDWSKRNCRKDDLYGWLARFDDYNSPGPIGEHLRNNGVLRSVGDLEREGLQETDRRVSCYARQIEETNKQMRELELKNNQNAMKLERMMEEKDRLVEEHNKKILKMQNAACQSSRKIIGENLRLHEELENRRKEIERRCKQLEDLATKSNIDGAKLEAAKEKNAKENGLLNLATQKQKEADKELLQLVQKQKEETDAALKKLTDLEMQLASKHKLELEIEQLRGKLEVMKHMGAEEDTKLKELDKLRETLEEKDAEMEDIDSLNQTLIIKERRTNDELEDAKKELISGLQKMSGARSVIGVKRMGELDQKAFLAACKEKTAKDDGKKLALLCSKWDGEIKQPGWHPFKIINVDGQAKEIIQEDDEKLQALKAELGEKAHDVVVKALLEMNEYNPSGRYPLPELWNFNDDQKASMGEVAAYLVKQWKTHKKKRTYA
ncbi:factor of DNA methylation 1-like [Phragmites australis]|uniref:factor of DNA methylation 1-like n=1 Tax=Phragmites australis TaxID=29695 RepID=UPI002D76C1B9|nr:factor of DNA methylation 1-like [Phragmites australis]XP_062211754.1 factor of DNA methylation 1-like [Phragmites australis]